MPMPPATTAAASASASASASAPAPPLHQTLPSPETQRHVAEARAAVVASIGNLVDSQLQSRAAILHENAAALAKQERDVLRASEALRREREKLAREADGAARRVKELGNVQNWAEVLERGFLVLEETVRLANANGCRAGSSCSECGASSASEDQEQDYGKGMMDVDVDLANSLHRENGVTNLEGKGPGRGEGEQVLGPGVRADAGADADADADADAGPGLDVDSGVATGDRGTSAWSDASRSLKEAGSGREKGSETASFVD
ncbi:uncharacterized protein UV8b_00633 [Ustilaginoidea virens]|uniref:Biogenesis of lysosome-related organelles complex 1 subunit 1 n=1 Tax=Ustilaginoidea virens TaxID=1159556 RepID=A0A8E5HJG3_USTVR|nr:uncharacterized protein UV8b_00633 [Ustilaginoidea virens]QUC16392.1 hypothetical protein UV8b_00633 [Ustilaginoidea virens]